MAEGKVLHGPGKVLSTDGKSVLDIVNFDTLVGAVQPSGVSTQQFERQL